MAQGPRPICSAWHTRMLYKGAAFNGATDVAVPLMDMHADMSMCVHVGGACACGRRLSRDRRTFPVRTTAHDDLLKQHSRFGYFFHTDNEYTKRSTVECAVLGTEDIHKRVFLSDHRPVILGLVL